MIREWVILGALAAFVVGGAGCATKADPRGDETHFEQCKVDDDCHDRGANARCESGHCTGGAGSAGTSTEQEAICAAIERTHGDVDPATVQSIFGADSASCVLSASDYDRSCKADDDCVGVGEGNACERPCEVACGNSAINKAAMAAYQADSERTPSRNCSGIECHCPCEAAPRCVAGTCKFNNCGGFDDAIDSGPP